MNAHYVTQIIVLNVMNQHNIVQFVPKTENLLKKMIQFVFVSMENGMITEFVKIVLTNA